MLSEMVPIGGLQVDPANVRLHSQRNIDAIKGSLARFGQQKPIVVDKDNVVRAGNGTLEAAKALGWEEIGVVRSELIGSEMTAFAIADNRTAELAEWDNEALRETLKALRDMPDDEGVVEAAGFEPAAIASILGERGSDLDDDIAGVDLAPRMIEQMTHWEQSGIRAIVMPFSLQQYEVVVEKLRDWRDAFGVESNSALFLALIDHEEIGISIDTIAATNQVEGEEG